MKVIIIGAGEVGKTLVNMLSGEKHEVTLIESEEGIDFTIKVGENVMLFSAYSFKARVQIMMGDIQGAENSLKSANEIKPENIVPFYLTDFFLSQFMLDMYRLKEEIKADNKSELSEYPKKALKSGKKAVRISRIVLKNFFKNLE